MYLNIKKKLVNKVIHQQDNKLSVEDELVTFRTKWQQEIQQPKVKPTSKQSRPSASPNEVPKYDNYSEEDIARNYFNKGIIGY